MASTNDPFGIDELWATIKRLRKANKKLKPLRDENERMRALLKQAVELTDAVEHIMTHGGGTLTGEFYEWVPKAKQALKGGE